MMVDYKMLNLCGSVWLKQASLKQKLDYCCNEKLKQSKIDTSAGCAAN